MKNFISGLLIMLVLSGCATVGPDYVRPEISAPAHWNNESDHTSSVESGDFKLLARWWSTFNDPELTGLIERAIRSNPDLRQAVSRVREARARKGISRAELFPAIDASVSAQRSKNSKATGSGKETDSYSAGFDASWELDLFGGKRRSVEAAVADLQASHEDLRDILVSLLAEVAQNYVEVRTYQARLKVAEENLTSQSETYQLANWRYEAGLSDELAVQQARYNLESTRSQIPTLRTGLEEAMNRIALLLGEQPGKVHGELEKPANIPSTPSKVVIGVPADVLRQRPDVRRTERELAAQTARVGEAIADLYPKFTLTGSIGLEAFSFGKLFSLSSRTFNGASGITLPIFNAGSVRQHIEVQSALQEQALIKYEASILAALEDVENALAACADEQQRRQSLSAASEAARQAAELAQQKYEAGLIDFTDVLDAQRSVLSFQDQLAQSNGTVATNLITLYKALGGGWTSLYPEEEK
jgi:outer membrane protein, multidrug efflux system